MITDRIGLHAVLFPSPKKKYHYNGITPIARLRSLFETAVFQALDEAAKAVTAAFDAAEKSLRDAQKAVTEKKEECKRKLELKCDNCKDLKCKQAEDDCKGFMDAAGKWIGKALSKVSDGGLFGRFISKFEPSPG